MVHCTYTSQYRVCCRKGEPYEKTAGKIYRLVLPFKPGRRTGRREQQHCKPRRNLSRGFSAKVTNYSIDVFDNLFLRVSLRQFYIKFYAFSLSKTVEKRSSVDYTKRLSNTSNKFFSANCLTTSCIVSSTKFAYSSFDIVINLFMDLSRSGK